MHRIAFITAALGIALALSLSGQAHAAPYQVTLCDASPTAAATAAIPSATNDLAGTAQTCPAGNHFGGLSATNRTDRNRISTLAPIGATAGWTIAAAPGTAITAVDVRRWGFHRANSGWKASGVNGQGLTFDSCATDACAFGSRDVNAPAQRFELGSTPSVFYGIRCVASACQTRPSADRDVPQQTLMTVYGMTVTVEDAQNPTIAAVSGPTAPMRAGAATFTVHAQDGAGVRAVRLLYAGNIVAEQQLACDYSNMAPCPPDTTAAVSVDSGAFPDGPHTLDVQVLDAAGNASSQPVGLTVDRQAPAAPVGLRVAGHRRAWKGPNTFRVTYRTLDVGAGAPLSALLFRVGSRPRAGETFGRAALGQPLALNKQGRKLTVWIWGEDAAGNSDPNTARKVTVNYDSSPPTVRANGYSERRPAKLTARVADRRSGVRSVSWEYQKADGTWTALRTRWRKGVATARFPYTRIAPGDYSLRLVAADRAGNQTTATAGRRGNALKATVYARRNVQLTMNRAAPGKRILVAATDNSQPVAGMRVIIRTRAAASRTWKVVQTVITGPDGRASAVLPASGQTSWVSLSSAQPAKYAVRSAAQLMKVRAASSIHASTTSLNVGQTLALTGTVANHPRPRAGVLLNIEAFDRGTWVKAASLRTDRHGRWSWTYRFSRSRGIANYDFRAVIPKQRAFPYLPGRSKHVRVTVYGS
jgi:hypothetical protein